MNGRAHKQPSLALFGLALLGLLQCLQAMIVEPEGQFCSCPCFPMSVETYS